MSLGGTPLTLHGKHRLDCVHGGAARRMKNESRTCSTDGSGFAEADGWAARWDAIVHGEQRAGAKKLSITVHYRWRRTTAEDWTFGDITFTHEVELRPDYTLPAPRRRLSPARQEQELQQRLRETWEDLMRGALYSVRDYFKAGGDGAALPKSVTATRDAYSGGFRRLDQSQHPVLARSGLARCSCPRVRAPSIRQGDGEHG